MALVPKVPLPCQMRLPRRVPCSAGRPCRMRLPRRVPCSAGCPCPAGCASPAGCPAPPGASVRPGAPALPDAPPLPGALLRRVPLSVRIRLPWRVPCSFACPALPDAPPPSGALLRRVPLPCQMPTKQAKTSARAAKRRIKQPKLLQRQPSAVCNSTALGDGYRRENSSIYIYMYIYIYIYT